MPPEEEELVEPTETEAEPEEETSPVDDTDGESEPEDEPEDREARSFRRVRDDLYRRQSNLERTLEGRMNQIMGMLQGISTGPKQATQEAKSSDPTVDRIRLQQDPRSLFREVAREEAQTIEARIAEQTRREIKIESAREELSRGFPELKDSGHPFYEATDRVYKDLLEEGAPEDPRTVLRAARIAAREAPDLREEKLKDRRRRVVTNGNQRPAPPRREPEAPRPPKRKPDELPELSRKDHEIARRWGMDLKDESTRDWIRKDRQELDKRRIYPVSKESADED